MAEGSGDEEHWRRQLRLDACADLYRAVLELAMALDYTVTPRAADVARAARRDPSIEG